MRREFVPIAGLTKKDKPVQHGGAREGAGRKTTGRKRLNVFVTDEEREAIFRAVPRLRETKEDGA